MPTEKEYEDFFVEVGSIIRRFNEGEFDKNGAFSVIVSLWQKTNGKYKDPLVVK